MMRKRVLAVLVSSPLWLVALVRADDPLRLTLDDAISRGMKESHRLAQAGARHDSALAGIAAARSTDLPIVSLQAGYTRTNHVTPFSLYDPVSAESVVLYPDVPDNLRTRLDLQWPIYTGGRSRALERAARAEADATSKDLETARADLKLEITRAFWAVVTASAAVGVLEQSVDRMDAHLRDARALLSAGLTPRSDVLSGEAERSRQQTLLIEARNLDQSARADLRQLTGLPPETPLAIDATLAPPPPPEAPSTALVTQARSDRPERQALEARVRGADDRKSAAAAGRLPSVSLAGGYDYARPNDRIFPRVGEWNTSWDVGVLFNWSVWDSGRVKAEVARAAADGRFVREGLLEFDTQLESDVRKRRFDLEAALAAVTSAEDGLRSAEEARRVVSQRYAAGLATNTEALDAQQQQLQAELGRTRAIANARLAAARLDRVVGH
jgi:outer membrane protein TolC